MKNILISTICLILALIPLTPAFAEVNFNPDFLISDAELTDYNALDKYGIQRVLNKGFLANYVTDDIYGRKRSAADIIWWTAQMHGINPKVLLVMLQKEQSLIEDQSPTQDQLDWALGYGVCDDCTHDDPSIQRWRGFAKQLNSAALQFVEGYLKDLETTGETVMGYAPGVTSKIDGQYITFANKATAALYTYTPHIHGNKNFVKLWNRYFGVYHPTGVLLQDNTTGGVYLIQFGKKRPITSQTALLSRYNLDMIIPVDPTVLEAYPDGTPISFPNYSLLQAPNGGIYLLVDDTLRPIASQEAFRATGFNPDEVVSVAWEEINGYETGEPITTNTLYPHGVLLQDNTTGGVFFVEDGIRHPIKSREILNNRFANWIISPVSPEELNEFENGEAVLFQDGTLIKAKNSPDVYVISEGLRRPILTEEVFLGLGWSWENIIIADESSITLHELGEPVYLATEEDIQSANID